MSPLACFIIFLGLQNGCVPVAETSAIVHTSKTENLEDEVSLVQVKIAMQPTRHQKGAEDNSHALKEQKQSAREAYWPQPRGSPGHYSRTSYGLPQEVLKHGNLTAHLAFKWELPLFGLDTYVWGTLLDKDRNIYIIAMQGLYKVTPDGEALWQREDIQGSMMGSLTGNSLCVMGQISALMTCVDIASGATLWSRQVAESTGLEGDMVTSNNGVLIAGVGTVDWGWNGAGAPSERAIGLNASTGDEIWAYTPDCPLWNVMGLFPGEDTVNFMDSCGGVYKVGLYNGSEVWKRAPAPDSWTDGGATLGPDGSMYTCSDEPGSFKTLNEQGTMEGIKGRVRKFKQSTGEMVWEAKIENSCLNFPAVSADGKTLVLADGENVVDPPTGLATQGMSREAIDRFYLLQEQWLEEKRQLSMWGKENINASIMGFDTQTGKMKWRHKVEPWWGMAFAKDEERAYNWRVNNGSLALCGPPHWGGPTIDDNGNIYIGRSSGSLYIYNPEDGSEIQFETNDGHIMSGVIFAPGLMSCSFVYVFRY